MTNLLVVEKYEKIGFDLAEKNLFYLINLNKNQFFIYSTFLWGIQLKSIFCSQIKTNLRTKNSVGISEKYYIKLDAFEFFLPLRFEST